MSRIDFLFQKIKEHTLGKDIFMKRLCLDYPDDKPTKVDFVLYWYQLLSLYTAMEERLKHFPDSSVLDMFNKPPFQGRSALLKKDIQEMVHRLSLLERCTLRSRKADLVSSNFIATYLENADEESLFAFLASRYLGDCHGGQSLSKKMNTTFGGKDLQNSFMKSVADATESIHTFVNQQSLSSEEEETFGFAVDRFFEYHRTLFMALESSRAKSSLPNCGQLPSFVGAHATFFKVAGAATVAAAATAGFMTQFTA